MELLFHSTCSVFYLRQSNQEGLEARIHGGTSLLEDVGEVEEDPVDATKLLEEHESHGDGEGLEVDRVAEELLDGGRVAAGTGVPDAPADLLQLPVNVGAFGTPQPHQGFAGRLVVRSRDVVHGRVGHEQHGHCIDHYGRRIASHIKTWSRS